MAFAACSSMAVSDLFRSAIVVIFSYLKVRTFDVPASVSGYGPID
jgi:hypothetical protein